jgi:hypothetical protein
MIDYEECINIIYDNMIRWQERTQAFGRQLDGHFEHRKSSGRVLRSGTQSSYPTFVLEIRVEGTRSLVPNEKCDETGGLMAPKRWLITEREEKFDSMI